MNLDIDRLQFLQFLRARLAAGQPARHIAADRQLDARRRSRPEMRIEGNDLLKAMKRDIGRARQLAEHGFAEMAVLTLGCVEKGDQAHLVNSLDPIPESIDAVPENR
jgi:hypothetical protein